MRHRRAPSISGILLAILITILVFAVHGQQPPPTIKMVPPTPTNPASGQEMFQQYCAVCHGLRGTGDGPAAPALKMMPADLTRLTAENQGKFPELRVYGVIAGDAEMIPHGTREMPVWGVVFRHVSRRDEAQVRMRLRNLTKYIESIQAK